MMHEQNLDHARCDPGHVLAPGLFKSLKKGDYKKLKLDIVYEFGDGERLEFGGKEPLGVPELRVLQGLIAMAGPNGLRLSPEPKTEVGQNLRLLLNIKYDAMKTDALVINGSYRALAKAIGYNLENTKGLESSIERLWGVSIIAQQKDGKRQGYRLLSTYHSNLTAITDGKLHVALNPRIANAILGENKHCRINLTEVRLLKSDAAHLMHQRLCGWIDPGKSGKAGIDTLCAYVWPDEVTNINAIKKRRLTARKALAELVAVGWTVSEYARSKFEIRRPAPLLDLDQS